MLGRLLIICDLGHCSHRIPELANHLTLLGWDVTVFTPRMSKQQRNFIGLSNKSLYREVTSKNFKMILDRFSRLGNKFQYFYRVFEYKKMRYLRFYYISKLKITGFSSFPEELVEENTPWIYKSLGMFQSKMPLHTFDLVLSSSSPISAHVIARELSLELDIPWCADFRDLWAQNHTKNPDTNAGLMSIEKKLLQQLSGAITVSDGFAFTLRGTFSGPIKVIHNSYKFLPEFRDVAKSGRPLSILYTGSIYDGFQDFTIILQALERINREKVIATINFIGPNVDVILSYYRALKLNLPVYVRVNNAIHRSRAHKLQHEADFGLLLNWEDPKVKGWESTKLFEYLGAGLPILATGGSGNDAVLEILSSTGAGVYLQTLDSVCEFLSSAFEQKTHGLERVDEPSLRYAFPNQSLELDIYLRQLISDFHKTKN